MNLDIAPEQLRELLYSASDMAVRLYTGVEKKKVFHGKSPAEVRALFDEPLPAQPTDLHDLLEKVERDVFGASTLNISPHFYGYVLSAGNPAGLLGEILSTALNPTCTMWQLSASNAEMEQRVVRWIAEFIGYPADTGGILVSGGSVANLTGLTVARKMKAPFDVTQDGVRGGSPLTVYVSTEGHSCLDKSVELLGLGRKQLRKIPVKADFTIDVGKLEEQIERDRAAGCTPICIIGNAGTVNSGAVDPLNALADLCAKYKLWFHVDGAYGAPAAGTALAGKLFKGIERADSLALDPHKWLYVPFEAGCVLVRRRAELRDTFCFLPDYLQTETDPTEQFNPFEYTFQLSRKFRSLKVWLTFKAYGAETLRSMIEKNIRTMQKLGELVDESEDFERLAPVPLSAICFRYVPPTGRTRVDEGYLSALNLELVAAAQKDGRVFLSKTLIDGKTALRACSINHRTEPEHAAYLLTVLRELGEGLHKTRRGKNK